MSTELLRVTKAARKAARSQQELGEAIRQASAAGETLRAIGDAAGLSAATVLRILRREQ